MPNEIIQVKNLTKIYKLKGHHRQIRALDNINFDIHEGEIFGLLGPNGAGKTTTIQLLTTIIQPTSGYATIDGHDILKNPLKAKSKIALMLGRSMIYYRITGYDNLKFFCKIYKVPSNKERIYDMAKNFGLENWLDQYVEKYSDGMKTKLALCRTFLLNRPILFLDEPTLGLDVKLKNYVINILKNTSKTILFTSHDMSVVEKLCDRIAFINQGKIIKIGTKEDIKKFGRTEIKIELGITNNKKLLMTDLKDQDYIYEIVDTNNGLLFNLKNRDNYSDLFNVLGKYHIHTIKEHDITLEDLFLKIIK